MITPAATTPLCNYINANYDYYFDSGDNTDCEYASSDFYINANYDYYYDSGDNTDCEYASSDNYYI